MSKTYQKKIPENIQYPFFCRLPLAMPTFFRPRKCFLKHGKWSDESAEEFFGQSTYLRPGRDNDKVKFHREKQYRISEMETLKGE